MNSWPGVKVKFEDFISTVQDTIIFVVLYLSRRGNTYQAVRDLAKISSSDLFKKISFNLRNFIKEDNGNFKDEHLPYLIKLLFFSPPPQREIKEYPLRIFDEEQLLFKSYIKKLEDKIMLFVALTAFIPIFLSLSIFFGILDFYRAFLFLTFSTIILHFFLASKISDYRLNFNVAILAAFTSTLGGIEFLFYCKYSNPAYIVLFFLILLTLYLYLKKSERDDRCKELLKENLNFELLLSWTLERLKKSVNFENALKEFLKNNKKELIEDRFAEWLFSRRHLLNSSDHFLNGISTILENSSLETGIRQIENLIIVLRKGRITLKDLCDKMHILKYKSDIVYYISSATIALVFALIFIFKKANNNLTLFLAGYIFSLFISSLSLDLTRHRSYEALKKVIAFIVLFFLINFCLENFAWAFE